MGCITLNLKQFHIDIQGERARTIRRATVTQEWFLRETITRDTRKNHNKIFEGHPKNEGNGFGNFLKLISTLIYLFTVYCID